MELSSPNVAADQAIAVALAHHQAGRLAEAERIYSDVLQRHPEHPEALHLLGVVAYQAGDPARAVELMEQASRLAPTQPEIRSNLGFAYRACGRARQAEHSFRGALALRPAYPEAHNELGKLLNEQGRLEEAERSLREALALRPHFADAHNNLAIVLQRLGRLDEAGESLRRALELWPDFAQAHSNRGVLLHVQRRLGEAEQSLRRAVALSPDYAEGYNNLGVVLKDLGRLAEAEACFQRALAIKPGYAGALSNLAEAQKDSGRPEEAVASYRKAVALEPDNAWMHSNLLLTLSYCPGITLAALAEEHAEFERRHAEPLRKTWAPHANSPDPDRKLRLGFVTPDLGLHPIGYLMADVLERLDRNSFAVHVYSTRWLKDVQTFRLMQSVEQWRDVVQLNDEALAQQIRADEIDILFDLSGHTSQNRLLVFARRPAPVQVTWMGYAGSTGLRAMDYLLTDANLVPEDSDRYYAERVIRMSGTAACYRLPPELPEVGPLPALRNGFVTFGSFNNPAKINVQVVALWSRILMRLPTARLVLKYSGFDDPACRECYEKLFAEGGVVPARLSFLGFTPMAEMFARYNEVDISLDPFPYTGGTTTLLALAMGVPVVSLLGDTMPCRQSLTMLASMDLRSLVTTSRDDYTKKALTLADDLQGLAKLRAGLRNRVMGSSYFAPQRFVVGLGTTVRELWRRWCGTQITS